MLSDLDDIMAQLERLADRVLLGLEAVRNRLRKSFIWEG